MAICICYVVVHSALYFLFVATLTVAMNSSDQVLSTPSISHHRKVSTKRPPYLRP